MTARQKNVFPRWIFAAVAFGALIACGIFIGRLTTEGFSIARAIQIVGFGTLGGLMFYGALKHH